MAAVLHGCFKPGEKSRQILCGNIHQPELVKPRSVHQFPAAGQGMKGGNRGGVAPPVACGKKFPHPKIQGRADSIEQA